MEVPVKTRSGQMFFVQVDAEAKPAFTGDAEVVDPNRLPQGGGEMGSGHGLLDATLFSRAVEVIKDVSEDVTAGLMSSNPRPSEVELSLNLGFDASGNVWIFKSGASANLKLVLKWRMP